MDAHRRPHAPADSTPLLSLPPSLAGHPTYEILRELGRGGMGIVYLARNRGMGRPEVIKVVNPKFLDDPATVERFRREIRSAAALSHVNIITAFAILESGDLLGLAMEYIDGWNLAELVAADGPLALPNACFYIHQVAVGLQHAFNRGLIHRDIKPQNVVVGRDGKKHIIKILDFGLAKATREQEEGGHGLTQTDALLGTPLYMAPEQATNPSGVDIRADIYSLGCTLHFLLSGGPPFQAKSRLELLQAHQVKEAVALNRLRAEVPAELAAVAAKMMAKEPARRYQTPAEAAAALAPFARGALKALPPRPPSPLPPPRKADPAGTTARQKTVVEREPEPLGGLPTIPGNIAAGRQVTRVERRDEAIPQVLPGDASKISPSGSSSRRSRTVRTVEPVPPHDERPRGRPCLILLLCLAVLLGAAGVGGWFLLRPGKRSTRRPPNPDVVRAAFGRPLVVLVGVNQGIDPLIRGRSHPENDAKALYDRFVDPQYLGVADGRVRLLLGTADAERDSQPATKENILGALRWLADEAGPNDLAVFAFFGPGVPHRGSGGGRHAYFAADSTSRGRGKDAVLSGEIAAALKSLRSLHFCALMDVDFAAVEEIDGPRLYPFDTGGWSHFIGHADHTADAQYRGRCLFVAANGLVCRPPAGEHGTFARALLDGLSASADAEGDEPDGLITTAELHEYLTKKLAPVDKGNAGKDAPAAYAGELGDDASFALVENPHEMPATKRRLDKFTTRAAKDKDLTGEIAEEGKTLLARMPPLNYQRRLRKEYQTLADDKATGANAFREKRSAILDDTKLSPAAARRFAEKIMEATRIVRNHYVKPVSQGDLVEWAIRGLYRGAKEKMPDALARKLERVPEMSEAERLDLLAEARQHLGDRETLRSTTDKSPRDVDIAVAWMLYRLGPLNTFYRGDLLASQLGQVRGIGVNIRHDPDSDLLLVVTPIYGSPAFKAGIQAGDLITTVTNTVDADGKPLPIPEVTPTRGMTVGGAVKRVAGKPGTRVKLTIRRAGEAQPLEFEVTRASVDPESVLGVRRKGDAAWDHWIDAENQIGYIRVTQFAGSTPGKIKDVVDALRGQGMKGLVLDIRFNPGGVLSSVRAVSDLFIDDGVIYYERKRGQAEREERGSHEGSHLDFPMACLVNDTTGSGSEILAACLQDHSRALILGERTSGSGSVQTIQDFDTENGKTITQLKITNSYFLRSSRKNIDKGLTGGKAEDQWGVVPDKEIKLSWSERDRLSTHLGDAEIIYPPGKARPPADFQDRQLDAAVEFVRHQIRFGKK